MKIISGDYQGKFMAAAHTLRGPVFKVNGEKFKFSELKTLKKLSFEDKRSVFQIIIILLCACTIVLIPIAIIAAFCWSRVVYTVKVETAGKSFVASGNKKSWKIVKKYIGIGG